MDAHSQLILHAHVTLASPCMRPPHAPSTSSPLDKRPAASPGGHAERAWSPPPPRAPRPVSNAATDGEGEERGPDGEEEEAAAAPPQDRFTYMHGKLLEGQAQSFVISEYAVADRQHA